MSLQISKLKTGDNQLSYLSNKEDWLQDILSGLAKKEYRLKGALSLSLNMVKFEPNYFLQGSMKVQIQQTCDRCAEKFLLPIDHNFQLGLIHKSRQSQETSKPEEWEDKEIDIICFEGNEIDLAPVIEEQFYLSLPFQTLCKLDCRGICQHCGQNLNELTCGCKKPQLDNAFSVLRNYKI